MEISLKKILKTIHYSDALYEFQCHFPVENRLRHAGIDAWQYIYMNIVWIFVRL
jgi:hypothetical protein